MPNVNKPSFSGGELKPSLHQRVDINKYGVGCKVILNFFVHASGGISNRAGTTYINRAKFSDKNTRLIEFEFNTEQAYALEFGHEYMRVIKDGGHVLDTAQNITAITQANPGVITITGHPFSDGEWVFVQDIAGMTELNGDFYLIANATANTFTLQDLDGNDIDTTNYTAYTSAGTVSAIYEIVTPYDHEDLETLKFTQSADVMTLTHRDYDPRELSRTGHASWSMSTPTFEPDIAAPAGTPSLSGPASSSGSSTIKYVITAIDEETGEESLPSNEGSTSSGKQAWTASDYIDISWTAVSGASRYNVYKDKNGFFGFIGFADSNSFRDDNIEPQIDDAPPASRDPFTDADAKPGTVGLYEQRRVFASTDAKRDTFFTSQTGNYSNFNVAQPAKPDDAITFTLASKTVNEIRHLVSLGDLIAFTSGGEWRIAGADNQPLQPDTVNAAKQSDRGCSEVPPIIIGNTALFNQARGKKIRDLRYTLEADGYDGSDISILSSHLFKKTRSVDKRLKEWCYQQEPDGLVWNIHKDGTMSSLTYQREHEVWAFARHETDGSFHSNCCIPEDDIDRVYFVVERDIGGTTYKYIEMMEPREVDEDDIECSFFVDCGVTITGNGKETISGLSWLEGKTVAILADGDEYEPQQVMNGEITLDKVYTTLTIGLPYNCDMQPLDIEMQLRDGHTKGKKKKVTAVYLDVYNMRGLKVAAKDPADPNLAPDETVRFNLYKQREWEDYDEPTRLKRGVIRIEVDSEWEYSAAPYFRHDSPLPCTILAITPELEISD